MSHHLSFFLEWGGTALALIGAFLNSRASIKGFYYWCAANVLLMVFAWMNRHWGILILYGVYQVVNVIGIITWRKKAQAEKIPNTGE